MTGVRMWRLHPVLPRQTRIIDRYLNMENITECILLILLFLATSGLNTDVCVYGFNQLKSDVIPCYSMR